MYIFYNGQFFYEARSGGTAKHDTSQGKINVLLCFARPCKDWDADVCYLYDACEMFARQKIGASLANSVAQPPQERCEADAVSREPASHLRLKQ